ncbi:MAG: D-alanine--D-alanine ligase A [Acidobacteria bacterium]|nr:MAG: D-alanine--D-alanine ligase A [Acidobacteriota bacterium]
MKSVGIVFGGKSPEHEISIISAETIVTNLDRNAFTPALFPIDRKGRLFSGSGGFEFLKSGKMLDISKVAFDELRKMDVIFPVLHGPFGEDGTIQGLLETMGIPYVGCGVESSALNMHKGLFRDVFSAKGIAQPQYRYFLENEGDKALAEIGETLPLPVFVKPCRGGSSIGISRVETLNELKNAVETAFQYDDAVIVEEGIDITEELEVAVMGKPGELIVAGPGKLIAGDTFYSYDDKYVNNQTRFQIPAEDLSAEIVSRIRELAVAAFTVTNCFGLARVDFLFNRKTGRLVLNEINTMPGFTAISMYPKLMMTTGMSFSELVSRLLELAFQRSR